MANQPQKLDKLFEEKLSQHQVKPSKLAWERLESQLPKKQEKETKIYWWAAAAAILVLIVSYSVFQNTDQTSQPEFVALESTSEETISNETANPQETLATTESQSQSDAEVNRKSQEDVNKTSTTTTKKTEPIKAETAPVQFTAMTEVPKGVKEEKIITEIPQIEIPDIVTDRPLIAEVKMELPTETTTSSEETVTEEPAYKLTIISDGIKDEKEKSLIAGIGKRVNQVEGLLGKVDEGFGELQEAKNSLFTSLISKRERTSEKPQ